MRSALQAVLVVLMGCTLMASDRATAAAPARVPPVNDRATVVALDVRTGAVEWSARPRVTGLFRPFLLGRRFSAFGERVTGTTCDTIRVTGFEVSLDARTGRQLALVHRPLPPAPGSTRYRMGAVEYRATYPSQRGTSVVTATDTSRRRLRWRTTVQTSLTPPNLDAGADVVVVTTELKGKASIVVLDARTGRHLWRARLPGGMLAVGDGNVYAHGGYTLHPQRPDALVAYASRSGRRRWVRQVRVPTAPGPFGLTMGAGGDRVVVAGSRAVALTSGGRPAWRASLPQSVWELAAPIVVSSTTAFVAANGRTLDCGG